MSPREYLRIMSRENPTRLGDFSGRRSLEIEPGQRVGVVLLGPGGPDSRAEVSHFLYRLFMDPVVGAIPGNGWLRHVASRYVASRRSRALEGQYEAIGGRAPIGRHAAEQARELKRRLAKRYPDLDFRTYVAMRYGNPSTEEALEQMADDGVDHAVLLPLYPQFAVSRTGSSLAYWGQAAMRARRVPEVSIVTAYAEAPEFIQAISERIDEAVQRFPRDARANVQFVFVAHGGGTADAETSGSTYCCQVHRTVDAVMDRRNHDHAFAVAFQRPMGLGDHLEPLLEETLTSLADRGTRSVLVVPVSIVTEQIDIAYRLDVLMRRHAESSGIARYEVAAPLNCHTLLLDSLVRSVAGQIRLGGVPLLEPESSESQDIEGCPRSTWGTDGMPSLRCRNCRLSADALVVSPSRRPASNTV